MLGSAQMAVVKPFRAVRYDERDGRPARRSSSRRRTTSSRRSSASEYLARSPYNVVHLTLPDSRGAGGAATSPTGASDGVLVRETSRRYWWLAQDYVGPDGVARTRDGPRRVAAGRAVREPASCCRTSARTRARRKAACGCCARRATQLEPIFLLYDGEPALEPPDARARSTSRRAACDTALARRRARRELRRHASS